MPASRKPTEVRWRRTVKTLFEQEAAQAKKYGGKGVGVVSFSFLKEVLQKLTITKWKVQDYVPAKLSCFNSYIMDRDPKNTITSATPAFQYSHSEAPSTPWYKPTTPKVMYTIENTVLSIKKNLTHPIFHFGTV